MTKMKAYVRTVSENNHVELMEIPIPSIEENEVLVKVAAFGVGIHDSYFIPQKAEFPFPIDIEGLGSSSKQAKR